MKTTIACVLKTGQWTHPGTKDKTVQYTPEHVIWLANQVGRKVRCNYEFVCLSDVEVPGVKTIKLKHNWPGWWSKMELFRRDLDFQKIFYLDLDTVITGDITEMASHNHYFSALRNLSRGKGIGSGIMAWRSPYAHKLYDIFSSSPEQHMAKYIVSKRWGDQGFIQDYIGKREHLQDRFPGQIISYTIDMNKTGNPPHDARIVVFHGKLKPWEVEASWIPRR